jgi:hypothetical protein
MFQHLLHIAILQDRSNAELLSQDRVDMDRSLFQRERPAIWRGGRDLGRRVKAEQQPPSFVAMEDYLEEPRVAILVPHRALGLSRAVRTIHRRHL